MSKKIKIIESIIFLIAVLIYGYTCTVYKDSHIENIVIFTMGAIVGRYCWIVISSNNNNHEKEERKSNE